MRLSTPEDFINTPCADAIFKTLKGLNDARAAEGGESPPKSKLEFEQIKLQKIAQTQGDATVIAKDLDAKGYLNRSKAKAWAANAVVMDSLFENFMGHLLSNPATQLGSVTGNTALVLTHIAEKLLSVPISKAMLSGPKGVSWTEGYAAIRGLAIGMSKARTFVNSVVTHVSNSEKSILENMGLPSALGANAKLFETNKAITPENWGVKGKWTSEAVKRYGQYTRLPGQMLTTGDLYFKAVNFFMAVEEGATREAMLAFREAQKADPTIKFDKQKFSDNVAYYKAQAGANPSDPITKKAIQMADENTFVNRLHSQIGRDVAESSMWGLRWAAPIIRVPMNVAARAWERTLPAIADPRIAKELMSDDPAVSSMAASRIAFGTMTAVTIMGLMAENLTGSAPEGALARQNWYDDGYKEDCLNFRHDDGSVTNVPFKYFGPIENIMKALARTKQLLNRHAYVESNEDAIHGKSAEMNSLTEDIIMVFAGSMMGDLWIDSVKEALAAASDIFEHKDLKAATRLLADRASTSAVGNAMYQQATKRIDPVRREAYSNWARIFRRFPILSKQFPPAISFWGEEVKWAAEVNPDFADGLDLYGNVGVPKGVDPVVAELRSINYKVPEMTRDHMNVKMTDDEFTKYKIISGQGLYEDIKVRMMMPDWSKKAAKGRNTLILPTDYARSLAIGVIVDSHREYAIASIVSDRNSDMHADVQTYRENEAKFRTKTRAGSTK